MRIPRVARASAKPEVTLSQRAKCHFRDEHGARRIKPLHHLRVFINQLRKKIEPDPQHPRYIHTEPWIGYRFEPPAAKPRAPRSAK